MEIMQETKKAMKVAAVIAEWNPFHNGHAYFLQEVRRRSGADDVIAVMRGDFVQRGIPAITDKYTRTGMGLDSGADLVIELPAAAATGSAGEFAAGAAAVLEAAGVVDELWFGSESGQTGQFLQLAEVLAEESPAFLKHLQTALGSGLSYPAAYAAAAAEEMDRLPDTGTVSDGGAKVFADRREIETFLAQPNNTLGLSYCIALRKRGSRIRPHTILREGADYHAQSFQEQEMFPSAEGIRQMLREKQNYRKQSEHGGQEAGNAGDTEQFLRQYMPEGAAAALAAAAEAGSLPEADDFSVMLFYRLLQETPESMLRYHGMSESLANRILSQMTACTTVTELAEAVKAKHLTRSGIDRMLLRVLLGIDRDAVRQACERPLLRILGFRNCENLLHAMHENATVPYEMRVSALPAEQYAVDLFASQLYEWVRVRKSGGSYRSEFQRMVVK